MLRTRSLPGCSKGLEYRRLPQGNFAQQHLHPTMVVSDLRVNSLQVGLEGWVAKAVVGSNIHTQSRVANLMLECPLTG